jgi:hypothetical protein
MQLRQQRAHSVHQVPSQVLRVVQPAIHAWLDNRLLLVHLLALIVWPEAMDQIVVHRCVLIAKLAVISLIVRVLSV